MQSLDQLNKQFTIDGAVRFEAGQGGLTRLVVDTPQAQAHVYLLGAHVTHWQPVGTKPVMFVSEKSWFEQGNSIRGGVPVCYPWFGTNEKDESLPNHGFARLNEWTVQLVTLDPAGRVVIELSFASNDETKRLWPHDFEVRHTITIGSTLTMALKTRNTGRSPFTITEALHTYFLVSDVKQVSVAGLEGVQYLSKVEGGTYTQPDEPIQFTQQTDRVYNNTVAPCMLHDPSWDRLITIDKAGSASTVVWNPWTEKAAAMPDFGDDEWPNMVCIETANALSDAVTVEPGATHEMQATLAVQQR